MTNKELLEELVSDYRESGEYEGNNNVYGPTMLALFLFGLGVWYGYLDWLWKWFASF